jgi:hypothetical protein
MFILNPSICKPIKEPRNRFLGLAGRHDNPILRNGPPNGRIDSLESILDFLKFTNSGAVCHVGSYTLSLVLQNLRFSVQRDSVEDKLMGEGEEGDRGDKE